MADTCISQCPDVHCMSGCTVCELLTTWQNILPISLHGCYWRHWVCLSCLCKGNSKVTWHWTFDVWNHAEETKLYIGRLAEDELCLHGGSLCLSVCLCVSARVQHRQRQCYRYTESGYCGRCCKCCEWRWSGSSDKQASAIVKPTWRQPGCV